MRLVLLHHPCSRGSEDWIQCMASTVSNLYIMEASDFTDAIGRSCHSKRMSLLLTTDAKLHADVPGQELATARCLMYERWPSLAKDLFHKRMVWDEYDMLKWISFMKTNFAPCALTANTKEEEKRLRVDTMQRKHWEHMATMFPHARVMKRLQSWLKTWHLDLTDPSWNDVVVGIRPDKLKLHTHVLPIHNKSSKRRMERLLMA